MTEVFDDSADFELKISKCMKFLDLFHKIEKPNRMIRKHADKEALTKVGKSMLASYQSKNFFLNTESRS